MRATADRLRDPTLARPTPPDHLTDDTDAAFLFPQENKEKGKRKATTAAEPELTAPAETSTSAAAESAPVTGKSLAKAAYAKHKASAFRETLRGIRLPRPG